MKMSTNMKYLTTFALFFCYFFYGVNFYVIGPTLIELSALFSTSIERICFIYTVRSAGITVGSLSGFLFNFINRQLAFIFFMAMMGFTLILMPHCHSLSQLFALGAMNGFSIGSFDTAINVWLLEIWGAESAPYMQALHFTYALGSFVAPLICEPFLSSKEHVGGHHSLKIIGQEMNSMANHTNMDMVNDTQSSLNIITDDQIRANPIMIYIPYAIAGAFSIASAVLVLILFIYKKYEPPVHQSKLSVQESKDLIKNGKKSSQVKTFIKKHMAPFNTIFMVTMGSLFLTFFVGMEQMHLQFLPTFAVSSGLKMSLQSAALVTSAAAAAFTVGRGLSIPLAIKVKPEIILYVNHLMMVSGTLILIFWSNTSMVMMWTGNIILGAGFSSVYASMYAFLEHQFQVTNIIGSIFVFAGNLTCALSPSIVGKFIEANPLILIWFNLICVTLCVLIFVIIHMTICIKDRQKRLQIHSINGDINDDIVKKVLI